MFTLLALVFFYLNLLLLCSVDLVVLLTKSLCQRGLFGEVASTITHLMPMSSSNKLVSSAQVLKCVPSLKEDAKEAFKALNPM